MKRLAIIILLGISFVAVAGDEKEFVECSIAGFFKGQDRMFLYEIALGVIAQNNGFNDSRCKEKLKTGETVGDYYAKTGEFENKSDKEIAQQASIFTAKIRKFIIHGALLNNYGVKK